MDRISKALEMARQQKSETPPQRHLSIAKKVEPIVYTKTRSIPVSMEYLSEKCVIGSNKISEPFADMYKVLRTRILQRMTQNNWKTLGITSAGPKEGKTLTAINLSISIAMEMNHTVLLVDTDLRRPSVQKVFGITPEHGLTEHLTNDIPIEDILVHPGIDRLVLLPNRENTNRSSELLVSPTMIKMVEELKTRYSDRIVIFDLPPVLVGDDVVAFAPQLDAILLVIEDGKTNSDDLARTLELLSHSELIGTVLNRSDEHAPKYDYYASKAAKAS